MADGNFSPNTYLSTPFSMNYFQAAERTLACGITSVREAGGTDLGVEEAQEHGLIPGPRTQLSITILSQTGGHGDSWEVCGAHMPGMMDEHPGRPPNIVEGPGEMRKKVRELIRAGADVIKVCTSGGVVSPRDDPQHRHFMPDELEVLVAEATAAHRFVMAHAQATEGIKNAVRAGIRSIEHGVYLDEVILDKARAVVDVHRDSIRRAIVAGVKIAMGTDSGVTPHGQNLRELALMADLGMSPTAVLESTTRIAAELMGVDASLGTLEVGKIAHAAVLSGTDLDVSDMRPRVTQVIQGGTLVASPRLRSVGAEQVDDEHCINPDRQTDLRVASLTETKCRREGDRTSTADLHPGHALHDGLELTLGHRDLNWFARPSAVE
jgi:imidazolonepropionase-like amidohydrolase